MHQHKSFRYRLGKRHGIRLYKYKTVSSRGNNVSKLTQLALLGEAYLAHKVILAPEYGLLDMVVVLAGELNISPLPLNVRLVPEVAVVVEQSSLNLLPIDTLAEKSVVSDNRFVMRVPCVVGTVTKGSASRGTRKKKKKETN